MNIVQCSDRNCEYIDCKHYIFHEFNNCSCLCEVIDGYVITSMCVVHTGSKPICMATKGFFKENEFEI